MKSRSNQKSVADAMILFGHGARNQSYVEPFEAIKSCVEKKLGSSNTVVRLGFLEISTPLIEQTISELYQEGHRTILVVPIFFSEGRHILKDWEEIKDRAKKAHSDLILARTDVVGVVPSVVEAMSEFACRSSAFFEPDCQETYNHSF